MRMRIVLTVLALLVAACGSDGGTATTAPAGDDTTTTAAPGDDATTTAAPGDDATTTAGEDMSGVHIGETEAGMVLVGPDGMTLYVFTSDMNGESTCYDACADLWPPVPGDTDVGADLDGAMFGTTTREDGSEQLTVNDMPLYWYTPDEAPGDAKGQGFSGVWFVVDVDGAIVEASAAADTVIDYDYGYGG